MGGCTIRRTTSWLLATVVCVVDFPTHDAIYTAALQLPQFCGYLKRQAYYRNAPSPAQISLRASRSVAFESSETISITSHQQSLEIEGILISKEFERRSSLHETLKELRQQIGCLLSVPLSETSAKKTYTANTCLYVGSENVQLELASDRAELISIGNAIVLAVAASAGVRTFFSSLGQQTTDIQGEPTVECQIALLLPENADPGDLHFGTLEVRWEATIPLQQPLSVSSTNIRGVSLLTLDPESNRIASHRLLSVYLNDSFLDSHAIGQSLSTLRQAVKRMQDSPLLQPFLSASASTALEVFRQVRDDFVQRQMLQNNTDLKLAPLFVALNCTTSKYPDIAAVATNQSTWIPIDTYDEMQHRAQHKPIPGSTRWPTYAACHRLCEYFFRVTIPMLSGSDDEPLEDTLFRSNACLVAPDGNILLKTPALVAGYYRLLATLRLGSGSRWNLKNVKVLSWGTKSETTATILILLIEVEFSTLVSVPGASPVTLRGKDVYSVSSLLSDNGENVRIEKIEQKQLLIGDNSNPNDTMMLMRSIATAVESSSGRIPFIDGFWSDLFRRLPVTDSSASIRRAKLRLPSRTDKSAVKVYRIMEALHQDCINIASTSDLGIGSGRFVLPPGIAFMHENLQLIGYLGETLLSGRSKYNQAFTRVQKSFHAAIQSGRLLIEKQPTVRVELSASGNIIWSLTLFVEVSPPIAAPLPGLEIASSAIGKIKYLSSLNIVVKSEYILFPDTGEVMQHRLLETRVNGQLTPGDIVSRWIQRRLSGSSGDIDLLEWLRPYG
jgi:hypothetical protein